jgi:hypothetical protein
MLGTKKGLQVTMMYNDDIWWRWSQVGVFFLSIEGDGHVPMNIGDPGNILWEPPREWVRVCYWKWLVIAMGLCLFSEIDASGSMFFFPEYLSKMEIFHSYVSLPECNMAWNHSKNAWEVSHIAQFGDHGKPNQPRLWWTLMNILAAHWSFIPRGPTKRHIL